MRNKNILTLIITVFCMFVLTGCGKKEIKLNDFISIETLGTNGNGVVYASFDEKKYCFRDFGCR